MEVVLLAALGLLGLFLAIVLILLMVIGRNLRSMAALVSRASELAENVSAEGQPQLLGPQPKRSMKEIFAVLPSLIKKADALKKLQQ